MVPDFRSAEINSLNYVSGRGYTLDLTFVLVFLVLMLMSYIFSYGAQLQELSDETL